MFDASFKKLVKLLGFHVFDGVPFSSRARRGLKDVRVSGAGGDGACLWTELFGRRLVEFMAE